MYRLLLKKRNSEVWHDADFGKDSPVMTFAVHDISNFDKRQSNYSQRLKLPLTDNNKRIFDFINAPNYNGSIYKDYLDARLFVNGQTLLGIGGVCNIVGVSDEHIEVCLLSVVKDFFTQLETIDFENTDILGTPRLPATDFAEGIAQVTDETDFVFVYYVNGRYSANTDKNDVGFIPYGLPMLRVNHTYEGGASGILPRLCSALGYTLQSDIDFTDLCLSLVDRKTNCGIEEVGRKKRVANTINAGTSTQKFENKFTIEKYDDAKYYLLVEIEAEDDDEKKFELSVNIYPNAADGITSKVSAYGIFDTDFVYGQGGWQRKADNPERFVKYFLYDPETKKGYLSDKNGNFIYHQTYDLVDNLNVDSIQINTNYNLKLYQNALAKPIYINTFALYASKGDGVALPGTHINIAKSLGWKNGREAMNNLCNIFGAIVGVNESTKTFYFNSLTTIASNKSKAKDWSDKLLKGVEQTFTIGKFAQKNKISMEPNSFSEYVSESYLEIENKTLEEKKDLLSLPLESPMPVGIYQFEDGNANNAPTMAKIMPSPTIENLLIIDKTYDSGRVKSEFYKGYEQMLNNGFIIDVELMLTDIDVATLDFFTPVYLRQYGRYFYINEIKNFVSGKPTEATLIAI